MQNRQTFSKRGKTDNGNNMITTGFTDGKKTTIVKDVIYKTAKGGRRVMKIVTTKQIIKADKIKGQKKVSFKF